VNGAGRVQDEAIQNLNRYLTMSRNEFWSFGLRIHESRCRVWYLMFRV
jgi:hypothetical protein